jgi:hypothetical protein
MLSAQKARLPASTRYLTYPLFFADLSIVYYFYLQFASSIAAMQTFGDKELGGRVRGRWPG